MPSQRRASRQEVYDDPDALEQDVQDAYDALIDAIDGLAFAGDLSGLQMLVDEAHELRPTSISTSTSTTTTSRPSAMRWPVQKKCWL
ncbi:MAG: hypothetical protein ACLS8R_07210 [Anaeromassilibacillus sp.]